MDLACDLLSKQIKHHVDPLGHESRGCLPIGALSRGKFHRDPVEEGT